MSLLGYIKSYLLFKTFPLWKKYYRLATAQTEEIKNRIYKFRYDIYRNELNQHVVDRFYSGGVIKDAYDDFKNVLNIYAQDKKGNIIGSIWMSVWNEQNLPDEIRKKYDLTTINLTNTTIGEVRYFVIRKDYRKSILGYVLIDSLYDFYAKQYNERLDLTFCTCQPGLIDLYRRFASFGYTKKTFYECGMLQIPLACYFHDDPDKAKHFNPITYHMVKYYYQYYQRKYATQIEDKTSRPQLKEISFKLKNEEIAILKQTFKTLAILFNLLGDTITSCTVLSLPKKCIIMTKDIVDFDLFVLLDGKAGVFIDNTLIAELSPGKIIGEMALLSKDHKRYSDIICLEDTRVLLIPRSFLMQLEKRDLRKANSFIKFLSINLITKLETTAQRTSILDKAKH